MNTFRVPASEALYFAQVILGTIIAIVVIILSYRAYHQTKFFGFMLWIASSVLTLCAVVGHAYPYPRIYPAAVLAYRSMYLVNSVSPSSELPW